MPKSKLNKNKVKESLNKINKDEKEMLYVILIKEGYIEQVNRYFKKNRFNCSANSNFPIIVNIKPSKIEKLNKLKPKWLLSISANSYNFKLCKPKK